MSRLVENLIAWAQADCVVLDACVEQMRSLLAEAAARIRDLEAQQTAGEPVACRCGKCTSLGLVDVDLSDKAHPRPREQTAGEPVACGCNGTDTVCVAHSGTVASAPHPRPRVGVTVTEEMVDAAAKILAYRLVGCTEKGWNGDAVFTAEQKAQILDDARVMLTAALTRTGEQSDA